MRYLDILNFDQLVYRQENNNLASFYQLESPNLSLYLFEVELSSSCSVRRSKKL